jgi:hypothetical protein
MKLTRAALVLCFPSLLGASCQSNKAEDQVQADPRPTGRLQNGLYYVERGAPDPLSCQADADCTADTVTQADGCCRVNNPYAQSKAWQAWLQHHTNSACGKAKCSTAVHMAPPPSCAFAVHCTAGKCADTCGAAPP